MEVRRDRDSRILLLLLHQLRSMPSTVKAILFTNRVRVNPDADEYSKAPVKCTRLYGVFCEKIWEVVIKFPITSRTRCGSEFMVV